MKQLFIILVLCFTANFSFAQSQLEMNEQANEKFKKADKELNATYKKILIEYKTNINFLKNLKISQNLWIKFRDAELNTRFPNEEEGYYGSFHPVCLSNYLTELTNKRIKELKVWLVGIKEGDMCSGSVKIKE